MKIAFFSPYCGFSHQEYLLNRFSYLPSSSVYIAFDKINGGWQIDSDRLRILKPKNYCMKILWNILFKLSKLFLRLRGHESYVTPFTFLSKRKLKKIILKDRIDVLLIQYAGLAVTVSPCLVRWKIPFFFTLEGSDIQMSDNSQWFYKKLTETWNNARGIFVISKFLFKQAELRGFRLKYCFVSYNGILLPIEKHSKNKDDKLRICMIANFHPVKGHLLAIHSIAHFNKIYNGEYEVHFVGDGPEKYNCIKVVEEYGLTDKFIFHGSLSFKASQIILKDCDINLQTSIRGPKGEEEGLSLSVLEAASWKVPSVVTPSGGLVEAVIDGVTGLVSYDFSPESISQKINLLANRPSLRHSFGEKAQFHIINHFQIEKQIQFWLNKMKQLLS